MKYNLRTLKGKRIVGGDPNLATKNEIHVSKIPEELGINQGEESNNSLISYFKIDYKKIDKLEYEKRERIYLVLMVLSSVVNYVNYHSGGYMYLMTQASATTQLDLSYTHILKIGISKYIKLAVAPLEDPLNIQEQQILFGSEMYKELLVSGMLGIEISNEEFQEVIAYLSDEISEEEFLKIDIYEKN